MLRNEEKIDAQSPKSASKIQHQSGNVNVFVLGTAMVIAAMWLVLQHDAAGAPTLTAAQAAPQASQHQVIDKSADLLGSTIEEVVVTAPRLVEKSEQFERPAEDVALAAPKAPKTFWQSPS